MSKTARATLYLVTANLAVYLIVLCAWIVKGFFPELTEDVIRILSLSPSFYGYYLAPWSIVTYMFTHLSFVHLTVNMLWLVGFGPMMKAGWKWTVITYLAGGICGALAFMVAAATSGNNVNDLAGASASVIAVVIATACLSPERQLRLFLVGNVRLKWIALLATVTIFLASNSFSPVTAAHMGGMLAGIAIGFGLRLRERILTNKAMESARQRTRRMSLLHKATQSGFASLSEPERLELFNLKNINVNQR